MNTQKTAFLFGRLFLFIVTVSNYLVNGQPEPWSAELTPVSFPSDADVLMRVYGNLAALFGRTSLQFCFYQNGRVLNCITAFHVDQAMGFTAYVGEFFDDGTAIYFIGFASMKKTINVHQLSVSKDFIPTIVSNTNTVVLDDLYTMSIDYRHRWMAVSSPTYLYIYDIMNPQVPNLISRSDMVVSPLPVISGGLSLYKNRVCTCKFGVTTGLACFTVRRGKFGASKTINPNYAFSYVKIYEDVIIGGTSTSVAPILIYNSSTLELMSSTIGVIGALDFFRSSDMIIVGGWYDFALYFINISDPRNPKLLRSSSLIGNSAISFSVDPKYFYSCQVTGPQESKYYETKIRFPEGMNWSTFYANSEWNGYGRVQNTLAIRGTLEYTWIFGITQGIPLNEHVEDTYLPKDIEIKLTVNVLASNFALEVFDGSVWSAVSKGQVITRPSFSSAPANKSLRIRDLNPDQPLKQPLNQTMELTADNGRGSQLTYNISIVRIYQSGPGCPLNGRCNNLTVFWCITGYVFDGTQCTNFRKQRSAWLDNPIVALWILGSSLVILFLIAFVAGFFESFFMRVLLMQDSNPQTLTTDSLASTRVTMNSVSTGTTETVGTTETTVIYSDTSADLTCNS